MKKATAATKNGDNGGHPRFPAEAEHFYEEVSEAQLKDVREATAEKFNPADWELVDGFDYPYAARA